MPAAPAPASPPSWNGCGAGCSCLLLIKCRSMSRRRAAAGSAHPWRVHWVRPELVAEVKFLTWTDDNLLRQVVYEGLREDKPAAEVRRPVPH
jgi:ATP-dependent DNA ligase